MVKKIFALLVCFIGLTIFFVSISHSQGSMKTITLPNGEAVLDLNGEWDIFSEWEGGTPNSSWASCKITQEGSSFVGVRTMPTLGNPKGSPLLRGELDKNGFKKLQIISTRFGPIDAKGQISEDGNRIIIDVVTGKKTKMTFTRKK
jgi:hypothetical protein